MLSCRYGRAEFNCQQITTRLKRKSITLFILSRLENSNSCEPETDDHGRSTNVDAMTRREMEVIPQQEEANLDTSAIYYNEEERQLKHNSRVTFLLT